MVKLNLDDIKQAMKAKGFDITSGQFVSMNTEQLARNLYDDFPKPDKPLYAGYLTYNPQVLAQFMLFDGILNAVFPAGVIYSTIKGQREDIICNMHPFWDFWEPTQDYTSRQTFHIFDSLHMKEILTDQSIYSNLDPNYAADATLIDFTWSEFVLNQATYRNYSLFTFLGYKLTTAG